jgi:hypothetical protein
MEMLFVICAVLGGTLLIAQFALGMLGFGHEGLDHDLAADAGHDFAGHDVASLGGDSHDGDSHDGSAAGSASVEHHAGGAAHEQTQSHSSTAHDSTALFKVLTFRTVVAATVFFGLAGLAAESAELPSPQPLLVALASGAAAMYAVFYLMQSLGRLKADGTQRISGAIGREGIVYLGIPAAHGGAGKIHLTLQNRLVEYEAKTAGAPLTTGTRIVVVDVIGSGVVEVAAVEDPRPAGLHGTRAHVG